MKIRWLIPVIAVAACAATEAPVQEAPDDSVNVPDPPPPSDAGLDAAPVEAEARPCTDCEYFPDVCSPDVLCSNGPFDAKNPGGSLNPQTTINTIRGRSNSDVWAVGALGAVARFDGTSWTISDLGSRESLRELWLRDGGEVTFGHPQRLYTRGLAVGDGGTGPSDGGWSLTIPTTAPSLGTNASTLKYGSGWGAPGASWFWMPSQLPSGATGLWRFRQSPSNAFESAEGISAQLCGTYQCFAMTAIHGASADELWAVGPKGSAVLVRGADGDAPTVTAFNTQTWSTLNGVWAASTTDAWAVGGAGTIRHYSGEPLLWDVVSDVPTSVELNAVWGASSTDIWAVGNAGVVLHYDGTSWSRIKIAGLGLRRPDLTTVWVAAPGHVWIGGEGAILSLGGKP